MANLGIKYMGLELKNPIIVGASNLVTDVKNLKKLEEAGAAAIVYKSLFEEQIQLEELQMDEDIREYTERNAEMQSLFPDIKHAGPVEHLMKLEEACKTVSIPVIASLNALYEDTWIEYAKKIEETGVAGIELNFYDTPGHFDVPAAVVEQHQIDILKAVKKAVKIPVAVKLSPFYTNTLEFIKKLDEAGADGFVLFNRLFQPDFDLDKEELHFPYNLSNIEDNRLPLRYAGLLYGNINSPVCCNSGIFSGLDAVKMILAGAACVQVVSTLYKNQISHITVMLDEMNQWLDKKNYASVNGVIGKLSKKNSKDPFAFKRAQYVDIIMKSNNIFKKYPLV
jgi:dihydroorotate dehydrogenase (fumarate)